MRRRYDLSNIFYQRRYSLCFLGAAIFGLIWATANRLVGFDLPISALILAVTVSSVTGGAGPGVLTTLLCSAFLAAWSLSPIGSGTHPHFPVARLITFVTASGVITALCSHLLRAKRESQQNLRRFHTSSAREHRLRQDYAVRSLELARAEHLFSETSQSLRRSEQKFRTIFENLSVGIGQVETRTLRLADANARLAELLGYTVEELLKLTVNEITHPDDREFDIDSFKRLVRGEIKQYSIEKRMIRKDGSMIWARINASASSSDGPANTMVMGIVQDITAEKAAALESLRAKEAAEKATEAKSYFLANMSHEIRTPLGAVVGFSELIGDPRTTQQERAVFLAAIKRNSELLSNIIDDILDLSKIEAGKINLDPHEVIPEDVITDIQWILSRKAKEKGISLKFNHGHDSPKRIVTDPLRLKQILINVIGNAIKFSSQGKVEVTTGLANSPTGTPLFTFEVRDTGPGIHADQVPKLFAPFSQADMTHKRKHGGTGLGLFLSRRLANLLGGDIQLTQTEVDKGSTFTLTIATHLAPLTPSTQSVGETACAETDRALVRETLAGASSGGPPAASPRHPLRGIRVLLAEDSVDNQILVGRILKLAGASVDIAANGQEALEKAQIGNYDTLLMDLQMPVMDGYEATNELRKKGYTGKIVAFTAHAFNEDRARCLQAGFDRHVSKPVNPNALISAITSLAGAGAGTCHA